MQIQTRTLKCKPSAQTQCNKLRTGTCICGHTEIWTSLVTWIPYYVPMQCSNIHNIIQVSIGPTPSIIPDMFCVRNLVSTEYLVLKDAAYRRILFRCSCSEEARVPRWCTVECSSSEGICTYAISAINVSVGKQ